MAKYPSDQFDDIPADLIKVGAHRGPPRAGRGWIAFAWAALFTGLSVVGGLYYLSQIGAVSNFGLPFGPAESATPSASASVDTTVPLTDPTTIAKARKITITVVNATTTVGLEKTAGDALVALKWPVKTRTAASIHDVKITVVYYSNPADKDIAEGLQIALGVGDIRESTKYLGAPITIVLGEDYVPL
jgi:LytR cell envelope-related transcriptional attenuator